MTGIYSAGFGAAYTPVAKPETAATTSNTALPIVAANQVATAWGDPRMTGANGGKTDLKDTDIFNLLSGLTAELSVLLAQTATQPQSNSQTAPQKATQPQSNSQTVPQNATDSYVRDNLSSSAKGSDNQAQKPDSKDEAPAKVSTESASYIWQLADTNGDGKLDAAEVQAGARKLQDGNPQHQATAQLMMSMLKGAKAPSKVPDFNGDGGISFDELSQTAGLDGDDSSISQADLNRLQPAKQDKPKAGTGTQAAPSMPQMMLQLLTQTLQVLSQLLQAGSSIR